MNTPEQQKLGFGFRSAPLPIQEAITKYKMSFTAKITGIFGLIIIAAIGVSLIASDSATAEQTALANKQQRAEEIQKKLDENTAEYQKIVPLAAVSRAECNLLGAREGQMKYLNAQSNALRTELDQLKHDLKIAGVEVPTKPLK